MAFPFHTSLTVAAVAGGSSVGITDKLIAEAALITAVWWMAARGFEAYEVQEWLWEIWRFVKQIIPLLIVGVFLTTLRRA